MTAVYQQPLGSLTAVLAVQEDNYKRALGAKRSKHYLKLTLTRRTNSYRSFKMGYEDSVYLAKLAEQAERYEGMAL